MNRRLACSPRAIDSIDLAQDEREDIRRGANDPVSLPLRLQGELEHLAGNLQVRGDEDIGVVRADQVDDVAAEHVVNDAGALLEIVKSRKQGANRRLVVLRMKLPNLFVGHLGEASEHLREVVAHVGVRTEPDVHVGNLGGSLQDRSDDVRGRAGDCRYDRVRLGFGHEAGVDVDDVKRARGFRGGHEIGAVGRCLRRLGKRAADWIDRDSIDWNVGMPRCIEHRAHVLAHEVDAENRDRAYPLLGHRDRTVCHRK